MKKYEKIYVEAGKKVKVELPDGKQGGDCYLTRAVRLLKSGKATLKVFPKTYGV
jgi:hypothetical protein